MNQTFTVKLLGTGAADHFWDRYGEPGVRGSAMALLDNSVLIDCGATGEAALARFHVAPATLTDLVFTHSHSDHFNPEAVAKLIAAHSGRLAVHASGELLATLAAVVDPARFEACALTPGARFTVASGAEFTALPANHLLDDPAEQAYHYLVEKNGRRLLYALDGAGFTKAQWLLIRGQRIDLLVIDCTMAESGDWRIFEHNDLETVAHLLKTLRQEGMFDGESRTVLSHLARTLWPESAEAAGKLAAAAGFTLAGDGMELAI